MATPSVHVEGVVRTLGDSLLPLGFEVYPLKVRLVPLPRRLCFRLGLFVILSVSTITQKLPLKFEADPNHCADLRIIFNFR